MSRAPEGKSEILHLSATDWVETTASVFHVLRLAGASMADALQAIDALAARQPATCTVKVRGVERSIAALLRDLNVAVDGIVPTEPAAAPDALGDGA